MTNDPDLRADWLALEQRVGELEDAEREDALVHARFLNRLREHFLWADHNDHFSAIDSVAAKIAQIQTDLLHEKEMAAELREQIARLTAERYRLECIIRELEEQGRA